MAVYTNSIRASMSVAGNNDTKFCRVEYNETELWEKEVGGVFPFENDPGHGKNLSSCCKITSIKLGCEYRASYEDNGLLASGSFSTKFNRVFKVNNNVKANNRIGSKDCRDDNFSSYSETLSDTEYINVNDGIALTFIASRDDAFHWYSVVARMKNIYIEYVRKRACYVAFTGEGVTYSKTEYDMGAVPSYGSIPQRDGYSFDGWSDGSNLYTDTLPAADEVDVTYTAQWTPLPEHTLSIRTYESTIGKSVKVEKYIYGTWNDITSSASNDGVMHTFSVFDGDRIRIYVSRGIFTEPWYDVYYSVGSSKRTLITTDDYILVFDDTVLSDVSVFVNVYISRYSVTVNSSGRIEEINCPEYINRTQSGECIIKLQKYSHIETFTVNGVNKLSQLEEISSTEYSYFIDTPSEDINIAVYAVRDELNIYKIRAANGSISGPARIKYGTTEVITFKPSDHAVLTEAYLDNVSIFDDLSWSGNVARYSLHDTRDEMYSYTFSAVFRKVAYITLDIGAHGTLTGETVVFSGESAQYAVTADEGYSIKAIYVGDEKLFQAQQKTTEYYFTLSDITTDITIRAEFTDDLADITVEQSEHGQVTALSAIYLNGTTLEIMAIADNGYYCEKWENESTDNPRHFIVNGDYTIKAYFTAFKYTIDISVPNGHGVIKASNSYANYGETVTLEAIADEGYKFKCWLDDNTLSSVRSVTVYEDVSLSAEFEKNSFSLTVNTEEGGTVTGNGTYLFETSVEVSATANTGYYFHQWSDGFPNSCRTYIIPAENTVLTAYFKRYEYDIKVEIGEGGSSNGSQTIKYGDNFVLNITAEVGYQISDVILDGVSVYGDLTVNKTGGVYTISNVTAGHTVKILFSQRLYSSGRKLIDYYPPVLQRILELQALTKAQEHIVGIAWDDISFVTDNQFIDTATDEGVKKWESELGIVPNMTDTLTERKQRLKLKWVPAPCYTMSWLANYLKAACGQDNITLPYLVDYTLRVSLPSTCSYREIFSDIRRYVPANIILSKLVELRQCEHNLAVGSISVWLVSIKSEIPNLNQEAET